MTSCDQIRAQLLEHLYNLLEEEDGRALDVHLHQCANCQAELEQAREQMTLIAAAAKQEFPNVHFAPPTEKTSEVLKTSELSRAQRRWGIRWAVAAGVLFAVSGVGVLATIYWRQQTQVAQADNTLRQAKDEQARADAHRLRILDEAQQIRADFRRQVDRADKDARLARNDMVQLGQDFQQKIQQTRFEANAKQMDLTIIGPRALEPGAPNQFHIQTRSFRLQPMPARITVIVRDQSKRELFKEEGLVSGGDLAVTLPRNLPLKPDVALNLEVQARAESDPQMVLSETLPLTGSLYVTHLTTDKPLYQPGEIVRFRSLTLERFSLQPPNDDLELTYKITKPTGEVTTVLKCLAAARRAADDKGPILGPDQKPIRGVGAGEYTIDLKAPTGQYTLTVSDSQQRFPPQERKFLVSRTHESRQRDADKIPVPKLLATDKELKVEFYPEGGNLVAGVSNRVYFQVLTAQDKPVDIGGRIVDESSKAVVSFRDPSHPEASRGLGMFAFTPQAGKQYQLKIDEPAGIEGKLTLPVAKPDGVVLSIPSGVNTGKEPIKVMLGNVGADRSLLIGTYCRGRLMSQQSVDVKKGEVKDVELGPESGVGGVYRITVFERVPDQARGESLEPRAERLIYRRPAGRLRLNIQPDKASYVPGERAHVRITARNENDQPQAALALVAVVNQGAPGVANEKTYRSMPAHFLLANEVRQPEDLVQADFLLSSNPQASKALDLLLGIQGWRRFAEQDPDKFQKELRLLALEGQSPPRSVNYGQEAVQKVVKEFHNQYAALEKRLTQAENSQVAARNRDAHEKKMWVLQDQAKFAQEERIASVLHVKKAQESLGDAADKFQRYRELLQGLILPGMLIVFLLATVANLVLAVRRRSQGRAIPYLTGAACSLLLVALALNQRANLLGQGMSTETEVVGLSDLPSNDWKAQIKLDEGFAKQGTVQNEPGDKPPQQPLIGLIKPMGPQPADKKDKDEKPQAPKLEQPAPRDRKDLLPRMPMPPPPPPPFVVREHVHLRSGDSKERSATADTLFWHPVLVLPDGTAEISFDLGDSLTTYQVIVAAHTIGHSRRAHS